MKKFIKENWFKVGVTVAILILSWVIYQGFVANNKSETLQKQPDDTYALKLSIQCREDGEKKLQEDKDIATSEKYKSGILNCYYMEPTFIFNHDLNTCLYSGGYICDLEKVQNEGFSKGEHAKQWTRHIVDIYSNKTLVDVYVDDSSNVGDWVQTQISDFWKRSKELGF